MLTAEVLLLLETELLVIWLVELAYELLELLYSEVEFVQTSNSSMAIQSFCAYIWDLM